LHRESGRRVEARGFAPSLSREEDMDALLELESAAPRAPQRGERAPACWRICTASCCWCGTEGM